MGGQRSVVRGQRSGSEVGGSVVISRCNGVRTTDYGPRTTGYGLRTTDYGLRTTDHGLRTTDYGPRTTDYCSQLLLVFEGEFD